MAEVTAPERRVSAAADADDRGSSGSLRVTFAVPVFPVTSQTFVLRQITGLLDLGHVVRILAERRPKRAQLLHPVVREYGLEERVTYVHEGSLGPRSAARLLGKLASGGMSGLGLVRRERARAYGGRRCVLARLQALLDGSPTDVLHCHFGDVGLMYAEPASYLGIPHVVTFHGYDWSRVPLERGRDVYHPLFERVGCVMVLGEYMKDRLRELGCPDSLMRRQRLGVDVSEYDYRERTSPENGEPVRLLTVARFTEKKGLEYALEAVARIREGRNLRYDIIGDGPLRPTLERRMTELGLGGVVHFLGPQDQAAVRVAMLAAHVFVLPSVTAQDGDQEGIPTVLLEASSTGLPVLSTWHSGIPDAVIDEQTGFLVPERDVDALASRLGHLLDNPELWRVMGRNGRRHIEESFDVRTLTQELVQHYRDVMEARR
jgi:colanic acid/amylovoran biosynthesis glycosyltransferase